MLLALHHPRQHCLAYAETWDNTAAPGQYNLCYHPLMASQRFSETLSHATSWPPEAQAELAAVFARYRGA